MLNTLDKNQKKTKPQLDTVDNDLNTAVLELKPLRPTYLVYNNTIEKNADNFTNSFEGETLFAVKTNPCIDVIKSLIRGGINSFDVSSLGEIELIRAVSKQAKLHFMNPVKKFEDIVVAYNKYQIRDFSFDHISELNKILNATNNANDLTLTLRVATHNNESLIDLSTKFGASYDEAIDLLRLASQTKNSLGVSFHVGTQTTNSSQYAIAIRKVSKLINESRIKIDHLNVGGGFPVFYTNYQNISSLDACFSDIMNAILENNLAHLKILAEPGRVLVADGVKLVTRVELKKEDILFINDGIYGGLFDASDHVGLQYPVKAISNNSLLNQKELRGFRLAGPTCDSLDMLNTPCFLPSNIDVGDWIVFENIGAYSQCLRSNFNGVGKADVICV